jgi:SAM-dependent methyltransferase
MDGYPFGDGDAESIRLARLEDEFDEVTRCALGGTGLAAGWRCWEIGAGRGSIAQWLAERVGPDGEVLATDIDISRMDPSDDSVLRVVRHDVENDPLPSGSFDLIHARFVLEHLRDPAAVLARLAGTLRLGGWLVLEDALGLSLEVNPPEPALTQLAACWQDAAEELNWHPGYGAELLADLTRIGLPSYGYSYRRHAPGGPSWQLLGAGLRRLGPALLSRGMTQADLDRIEAVLAEPRYLLTGPPTIIALATTPSAGGD